MSRRHALSVALALAVALPGVVLRLAQTAMSPELSVLVFGAGVVSASVLLSWAGEAAEADLSTSMATAILALIAVLPEYAVDLYFAYVSGHRPEYAQYAAANMTGSNRLLLGLGWPVVVFVSALAARRGAGRRETMRLEPGQRIELGFLAVAGAYCFLIPLAGRISIVDSVVLLVLFCLYARRVSWEPSKEHEPMGVAASLVELPPRRRKAVVAGLFAAAAAFILVAAEPFAEGLVASGKNLGIDEFLLVQWLAPLSSEAPEFIVATLLAWRGRGGLGVGTLLSSKVNQWTLLIGSLPVAHAVGGGGMAMLLDARQVEEILLTAAQTVLGFGVLVDLELGVPEASVLLALFAFQFVLPGRRVRLILSAAYLGVAALLLTARRAHIRPALAALMMRTEETD